MTKQRDIGGWASLTVRSGARLKGLCGSDPEAAAIAARSQIEYAAAAATASLGRVVSAAI